MKKIAILQSNYIPWKGYFDLINSVDEFVFYDDMQYTRRDWRNRNKIKTPQGLKWLTVPVKVKGKFLQKIKDTEIDGCSWSQQHWLSIELNYKKARYFYEVSEWLQPLYKKKYDSISNLNITLITAICCYLGIKTKLSLSCDYDLVDGKSLRLADICRQANANVYVSGPAAKDYLNEFEFEQYDVNLEWFEYSGYPEYTQLWNNDFCNYVSILDVLFNCGQSSYFYIRKRGFL